MKLAVMQPYFFPYIGYFQLIGSVDTFVVYDNIKYTKKGWINRNRYCRHGQEALFSVPLKKASDDLDVCCREVADAYDRKKLLLQFKEAYRRAPYFDETYPMVEDAIRCQDKNLFLYIFNSIARVCAHVGIPTELRVSSEISIDHGLRSQAKIIALCRELGAKTYINAIGGLELYNRDDFESAGIQLAFLKTRPFDYAQSPNIFIPWLSIIDVLMCNGKEKVRSDLLFNYDLAS